MSNLAKPPSLRAHWAMFVRNERGATAIEYTLFIALMSVGLIIAASPLADRLRPILENTEEIVRNARQ